MVRTAYGLLNSGGLGMTEEIKEKTLIKFGT